MIDEVEENINTEGEIARREIDLKRKQQKAIRPNQTKQHRDENKTHRKRESCSAFSRVNRSGADVALWKKEKTVKTDTTSRVQKSSNEGKGDRHDLPVIRFKISSPTLRKWTSENSASFIQRNKVKPRENELLASFT